jgi:hypothetical protein
MCNHPISNLPPASKTLEYFKRTIDYDLMNIAIFALTGVLTVFGIGYLCVDLYRNRKRRLSNFEEIADFTGLDLSGSELQRENETVHHAAQAAGEASHSLSDGVGHYAEAIAHTLSHH